jgi:hypothetical protein
MNKGMGSEKKKEIGRRLFVLKFVGGAQDQRIYTAHATSALAM